MLDYPIQIGKVNVMVINPLVGIISAVIKMNYDEFSPEYAKAIMDLAVKYMEIEGIIQTRKAGWTRKIAVITN